MIHVISSFEHSTHLEIALVMIEQEGVPRAQIFAVPLRPRQGKQKLFDTIHRSDGGSLFDGGAVLGTVCMLLGAIYGFIWRWGPVLWGLIGLGIGFTAGVIADLLISRRKGKRADKRGISTEVVVMVHCKQEQAERVEAILWQHQALGVAKLEHTDSMERA